MSYENRLLLNPAFCGGNGEGVIRTSLFHHNVFRPIRGPFNNSSVSMDYLFCDPQIAIGMIVLVCGLVPLIGHFLGCGVVTIIALTQSITIGLIAFVAYVLYVQVENYVVTPRIMKRTLSVPGAVTIISAMIGSSLLGLIGGLLAVPVAAAVILILDEVVIPKANNE